MAEVLSLPDNKLTTDRLARVDREYWLLGARVVPDVVGVKRRRYHDMPQVWDIAWLKKRAKSQKLWRK